MRVLMDFGAPARRAGLLLLATALGVSVSVPSSANDVAGRKRCFVAGVETYKDEPVYRDKSSGYQRVQVPGSKGERCFWEPLDYQEAAAAAPVRPSRAAPSTTGPRARRASRPAAPARTASAMPQQVSPNRSERPSRSAPPPGEPPASSGSDANQASQPAPQRQAALTQETRRNSRRRPEPQPQTQARRKPDPRPAARPQPTPPPQAAEPEPAPPPRPEPTPPPQATAQPEPAPPPRPEPVTPVLEPRGLSSGGNSGPSGDVRIQTRPVTTGGTVSTVSSGPDIEGLLNPDQQEPAVEDTPVDQPASRDAEKPAAPARQPMQLAQARNALASLTPRTSLRGREPERRQASPPARETARQSANKRPQPEPRPEPARRSRSSSPSDGDGKFVQLGSVTSYQKAKQFWTDVTGRYPEQLAGFSPDIVEADIPGKGIYYRVRVGPLPAGDAKDLCERLDGNCLVVSP